MCAALLFGQALTKAQFTSVPPLSELRPVTGIAGLGGKGSWLTVKAAEGPYTLMCPRHGVDYLVKCQRAIAAVGDKSVEASYFEYPSQSGIVWVLASLNVRGDSRLLLSPEDVAAPYLASQGLILAILLALTVGTVGLYLVFGRANQAPATEK